MDDKGTTLIGVFGLYPAHENDPHLATQCAMEMVKRLRRLDMVRRKKKRRRKRRKKKRYEKKIEKKREKEERCAVCRLFFYCFCCCIYRFFVEDCEAFQGHYH